MEWQELEKRVRLTASYLWDCDAEPETINGVKIDCVCKLRPDYWVIVEITQEKNLDKLRTDLAKFAAVRPYLFSKSTYSECYFVCESKPPTSLVETGRGQNVTVVSLESFQKRLFDFSKYSYARVSRAFGSAIDPSSGKKDDIQYVPVEYVGIGNNRKYSIEDLAGLLMHPNRIVLTGGYGTGKSRCVQELFAFFERTKAQMSSFPIAINLRDHWGTRRGSEIIRRHFDDFGLGGHSDNVIKVMPKKAGVMLLLDGFDEIASQTWSDDPTRLKDIRAKSLLGVKDLISQNGGGLLITGREHYFNSDKEMFQCLGLNPESTMLLRCPDEFTDEEMVRYLKNVSKGLTLPQWLPRRPLICKILADIEPETLAVIMEEPAGEAHFWQLFIKAICEREARINPSLDAATIENVLCEVASRTRVKIGDVGPVSTVEINQAFEKVVGLQPSDESAIIL